MSVSVGGLLSLLVLGLLVVAIVKSGQLVLDRQAAVAAAREEKTRPAYAPMHDKLQQEKKKQRSLKQKSKKGKKKQKARGPLSLAEQVGAQPRRRRWRPPCRRPHRGCRTENTLRVSARHTASRT